MAHDHSHGVVENGNERPLWWALGLTTAFMIAEVIAGVMSNSLALISDAAHMFTDTAALAIALAAIRIAKRLADKQRTFGYYRFEILAAAFNAILLFLVAIYILYEAWKRFQSPPEVHSTAMLVVAILGLLINVISMRLLMSRKDDSLNVKGAYLEVWSDMLGSAGVIVGALLIKVTGWAWVDSAVAVGIGLWVLPRTWTLLRESLNILVEGVPEGVELEKIEEALAKVDGVESVHDLHVWAISSGKLSLTAHVVSKLPRDRLDDLLTTIRTLIRKDFNIWHTTIQIEATPCEQADSHHSFKMLVHTSEHLGDGKHAH